MKQEWFYTRDGKSKSGPVSSGRLKTLAKTGGLLPKDMVLMAGTAKWIPAGQIKGLFQQWAQPSLNQSEPVCANEPETTIQSKHQTRATVPTTLPGTETSPNPFPQDNRGRFFSPAGQSVGKRKTQRYKTWWFLGVGTGLAAIVLIGCLCLIGFGESGGGTITFAESADPESFQTSNEGTQFTPGWVSIVVKGKEPFGDTKLVINSQLKGEDSWKVLREEAVDAEGNALATQIPLLQAGTHNINVCTSNGQEIARATVDIVDRPFTAEEIYRQFLQSTVWIITLDSAGQRLGWGSGSLVHRGQKLILTNFHVIKDQRRIVACFPRYKKTTDGNELITAPQKYLDDFKKTGIKCEIIAKDSGHDLALVQLDSLPPYSPVVPLNRKSPNIGANVYSIGASGVTLNRKTGVLEGTLWRLTTGQVRQVYERDDDFGSYRVTSYVVETNAAVNRGDSGGPVVNDRGQMVAVVSSGRIHDRLVSHNIDVREVRAFLRKYLDSNGADLEDLPSIARLSGSSSSSSSSSFSPHLVDPTDVDYQTLVEMVKNPKKRLKAVHALGRMGGEAKAAIPTLVPLLKDRDPDVRRAASAALEKIGVPAKADYDTMIDFLKHENSAIRIYAARAIRKMLVVTPKTIKALKAGLQDTEVEVRHHALLAMARLGRAARPHVVPALLNALADADPGIHAKARDGLTRLRLDSKKDFNALKEGIKHKDMAIRVFAMKVFVQGAVNPEIASILIDATKDSHAKVRKLAVEGLAKSDLEAKEMALPALMDALKDKNKNIRQAALESLDKFGKPQESEIPRLIKCLQSDMVEVRLYAMQTLVKVDGEKTKRAVYAFAELLNDEEKRIGQLAAQAIGNIGMDAKSFAPQLQQVVLKDTDKELRRQAIGALAKIGHAKGSVQAVISALDDRELRKNALDCLTKIGPFDETDIPAFGSMLKSSYPEARSRAVMELGKQGNKAVKLVILALKDKDTAIRLLAATALGGIKGKEAALALTDALPREEECEVRDEIVLALGKVGPEAKGAIPHLSKVLLSEKESKSRQKIAMVLGKLGPAAKAAVPSLAKVLMENDSNVRKQAAMALAQIGPEAKAAIPKLIYAFEDESAIESAAFALAKIGKAAVPALIEVLKDRNPYKRLGATLALGQIGPDAKEALVSLGFRAKQEMVPLIREATRLAIKRIKLKD